MKGSIEFEFVEGQGFVVTAQAVPMILSRLAQGNIDGATELYASAGADVGEQLLAEASNASSATRQALAQMLVQVRDYRRASELYLATGDKIRAAELAVLAYDDDRAARLYASAGDHARAARLFEKRRDYVRAAKLYLEGRQLERAAACLIQARRPAEASKLLVKQGMTAKAVALLERVRATDPSYPQAALVLGELYDGAGQPRRGLQLYVTLVNTWPCDERTVEAYFRLACGLASLRDLAKAVVVMERVVAFRPDYKEAKTLLATYRGARAVQPDQSAVARPAVVRPPTQTLDLPIIVDERAAQVPITNDALRYLRELDIFRELSLDNVRALSELCQRRRYASGQRIIEQGRPGEALFILQAGEVDVVRRLPDGGSIALATLGAGSCVGEVSLVDSGPTSADVIARNTVAALAIPRQAFEELLDTQDELALRVYRAFVKLLAQRLRLVNDRPTG